jgi:hypothetical protein
MTDTTSIMDLPTDPVGGGTIGGISFSANENIGVSLDQSTINQIVNGLQQASSTGATQLHSRDIPMNTSSIIQDPQVQPNYIPPANNNDYIGEYEENDDIINKYNKGAQYTDKLDQIYDELQTPILLSIMYFLFQLPFFKKLLYKFFPALFLKDGNINLFGYIFNSTFFGLVYYILSKVLGYFN